MPKIIPISGIIANYELENESNVTPSSLRKSLDDANGEDILVTINSPGGSVFPGLEMFSLLKNYPGNVETRIVSFAASMGSVLALAGDKKSAENTAMYYIHNAQGYSVGDYRDLISDAEFLEDVSILIANLYEEYTNLTLKEAREYMDGDSHFFGPELELLGFEIVEAGESATEAEAQAYAKNRIKEVQAKLEKEIVAKDSKIAACLDYSKYGLKAKTPASAGENKREVNMTLSELLKEHPAAKAEFNTAVAEAQKAGGEAVSNRIASAAKFVTSADYPESIRNLAIEVINGEKELVSLTAAVSAFDAAQEAIRSSQATQETNAQGDIAGGGDPQISEDGEIKNDADHHAAVARARAQRGL
jgi:ATP-dependent protease ClpP protease subunit